MCPLESHIVFLLQIDPDLNLHSGLAFIDQICNENMNNESCKITVRWTGRESQLGASWDSTAQIFLFSFLPNFHHGLIVNPLFATWYYLLWVTSLQLCAHKLSDLRRLWPHNHKSLWESKRLHRNIHCMYCILIRGISWDDVWYMEAANTSEMRI